MEVRYQPFAKIKGMIRASGYSAPEISVEIGLNKCGLTDRLNCRVGFQMFEIYRICAAMEIPFEKIPEYFPPEDCEHCEKMKAEMKAKRKEETA